MKNLSIKLVFAGLLVMQSYIRAEAQDFKAKQFVQSASIVLNGNIEKVFPLFGAMEEKKWSPDWQPMPVFPASGKMEEGFIFKTPDHVPDAPLRTWIVAKYDLSDHLVKYIVATANQITMITVHCSQSDLNKTKAEITYTLTGLNEEGNEISQHLIIRIFKHNLQDWETAINQYLAASN